eukprot:GHRQ01016426.1.p1 GENE.GHRQ01016426.1~~GHRQ01016426.1.p1  ORF type:complete len:252 (+),score=158.14 GHRQ01016426.1:139-894(+)
MTVLEGLALQADANYKLLGRAYPYIARRLLTDPAPELRASFEDLVIKDNQLRWNRLENLLREGSKSQDFDSSQLWMLATWLLSENAAGVRAKLAAELARMLDAAAAADARDRIARSFNSAELANRLVPVQPTELEARARAALLMDTVAARIRANSSSSDSAAGSSQPVTFKLPQGSGPLGMLTPADVSSLVASVQASLAAVSPQLQQLAQQPGAAELVREVGKQLSQRFAARVIKFAFGSQDRPPAAAPGQ